MSIPQLTHTVKNGKIHNGKQNFKCRECGRQFVKDPQNKIIDQATKTLIDKLPLEKIPLAGIAIVVGVSEPLAPELCQCQIWGSAPAGGGDGKKKGAWQFSVMRCGLSWATRAVSSEFGSL